MKWLILFLALQVSHAFSTTHHSLKYYKVDDAKGTIKLINALMEGNKLATGLEDYFKYYCNCDEQLKNLDPKLGFKTFITDFKKSKSNFSYVLNYPTPDYENNTGKTKIYHFALTANKIFEKNSMSLIVTKSYGMLKPLINIYMSLRNETDIPVFTNITMKLAPSNADTMSLLVSFDVIGNLSSKIADEQLKLLNDSLISVINQYLDLKL